MSRQLPIRPDSIGEMTPTECKAAAWEAIWDWCQKNGLTEYSFLRQEKYRNLNGPQMIAQWILDLAAGDGDVELEKALVEAFVKR